MYALIDNMRRKAATDLLIGGHRGHCAGFTPKGGAELPTPADLAACPVRENTVANFERLLGLGLSHIEIDVQLTADGEAVIYHDIDLAENSALSGRVHDHTLSELMAAFPINTLDEALAFCARADMPVALEIKCELLTMQGTMPLLAQRVADALSRHRMFEMSFVLSTDHATLARIKRLAPETNLSLIVPHVPHDPLRLMAEMDALIYLCYLENLSPDLVRALHGGGYFVDGSRVNSARRLSCAVALGVDMIESDCPAHTMAAYRSIVRK